MLSCMLSWLTIWWCTKNPLKSVIEVSQLSHIEIAEHREWPKLCHVDGDGVSNLETAETSLDPGGWSSCPVIAWINSTFDGFQLPSSYSQSANRDNNTPAF